MAEYSAIPPLLSTFWVTQNKRTEPYYLKFCALIKTHLLFFWKRFAEEQSEWLLNSSRWPFPLQSHHGSLKLDASVFIQKAGINGPWLFKSAWQSLSQPGVLWIPWSALQCRSQAVSQSWAWCSLKCPAQSHPLDIKITAHPGSFLPGHIKRTTHTFSSKPEVWARVWAHKTGKTMLWSPPASALTEMLSSSTASTLESQRDSWKSTEEFSTPNYKHLIFNNLDIFPVGLLPCLLKVTAATSLEHKIQDSPPQKL